jgi:nucleoside-diphosphate-sugar epimerase
MKILVCGNLGYVGPVVCKHLKSVFPGAELTGLDTAYFATRISTFGRIGDTYCDVQFYKDIRDVSQAFFNQFDSVVLLSAISNDPMGNKFEKVTNEINYIALKNLVEPFVQLPNKRLVFASSCSMYGSADSKAKKEDDELNPLTAYAKSKVAVEKVLKKSTFGVNSTATSLRFATACGMSDRLRLDLVLNDFVASAILSNKIEILSDGSPWRPLINVHDMARAIEWALLRDESIGSAYLAVNTGSNSWNYKVSELAKSVADKLPNCEVTINKEAPKDKRSYRVNFDLFEALAPNHVPVTTLHSTIDELVRGIHDIKHLINKDFRSSDFMRLHILESHLKSNRLSEELRWLI